jgi:ATP-dependent Lhr-like helicase
VLETLEGFVAPAAAWEEEILPARVAHYDPAWLDALCAAGRVTWTRILPPRAAAGPVRSTPIVLVPRCHLAAWQAFRSDATEEEAPPSPAASSVDAFLAGHGAAFFEDLVAGTRLLRTQVEQALAELVARGRVSADSFVGLRALLVPSNDRRPLDGRRRRRRTATFGVEDAGRWARLAPGPGAAPASAPAGARIDAGDQAPLATIARALLRRWGVVCRRLLDREGPLPPWRELLRVYRRWEARGEIRGGRFVAGLAGEQYALPEAVAALRDVRRRPADGALLAVSGADPLNLAGILTPGARLAAIARNRILWRDGVPIACRDGGATRTLVPLDATSEWRARKALVRRATARETTPSSASRR